MDPLLPIPKTISDEPWPAPSDFKKAAGGLVTAKPKTVEAEALLDEVLEQVQRVDGGCRKRGRGPKQRAKLKGAVAAILGDLLWNYPKLTYIATNSDEFSGQVVSFDAFNSAKKAMIGLGLMGTQKGYRKHGLFWSPGEPASFSGAVAPRFWPMPALVALAEAKGVLPDATAHFERPRRKVTRRHLVVLREKGTGFGKAKAKGKRMTLPKGPHLERLRDEITEVNQALASADIEECHPPVLVRSYNLSLGDGNAPALHGRWYDRHQDSYMQMPKGKRKLITMGGEPVVEADVSASQFWCFYGAAARADLGFGIPDV